MATAAPRKVRVRWSTRRRLAMPAVVLLLAVLSAGTTADATPAPQSAGTPRTVIPMGIEYPWSVAVDGNDDVFVAELATNRVVEVTAAGVERVIPFTGITYLENVAADAAGDVFVSESTSFETGNAQVLEWTKAGQQRTLPFSGLPPHVAIAADAAGDVVAGGGNGVVDEVPHGGVQESLPFTGLSTVYWVAMSPSGDVYVNCVNGIKELPVGGVQKSVAMPAFEGLAVDAAGDVFEATEYQDSVIELSGQGIGSTLPISGLDLATSVAVDAAGRVFVADYLDHRIVEWTGGKSGGQTTVPFAAGASDPYAVAVDGAGDVFVADDVLVLTRMDVRGSQDVLLQKAGNPLVALDLPDLEGPHGATSDAAGDLFIADTSGKQVLEWSEAEGEQKVPLAGLTKPTGIAVDPAGDLFVSDTASNTVTELSKAGATSTLPFTGLSDPTGLAVDAGGDVFVADAGNDRVVELPVGGAQETVALSGLSDPMGVAVDTGGDLFVADTGNDRVIERPAGGGQSTLGLGGLLTPRSVAVAGSELYVADLAHGVQKLSLAPTVPAAPTIDSVTGGSGQASVAWSAPDDGGSAITGYTVTPYAGGMAQAAQTFTAASTTHVVTGLTNGVSYTFRVAATNALGTGTASAASSVAVPPYASPAAAVQSLWAQFLGRPPTAAEEQAAVTRLHASTSLETVVADLRRDTNGVGSDQPVDVDPVARLYAAYFLRIPDAGGLAFWVARKRAGRDLYAISSEFAGSSEFRTRYGSLSNQAFVTLVYQNVLHRAPDADGLAYWTAQLDGHGRTRGQVMVGFSESHEYRTAQAGSTDVVVTWTMLTGAAPSQATYDAWAGPLEVGTKALTDLVASIYATMNVTP